MTTRLDGMYALYPDGCGTILLQVRGGRANWTEESCFQSHLTAGDWWADWIGRIVESEDRDMIDADVAAAIIRLWDEDANPDRVVVVRIDG